MPVLLKATSSRPYFRAIRVDECFYITLIAYIGANVGFLTTTRLDFGSYLMSEVFAASAKSDLPPSEANCNAAARPIPEVAPVMTRLCDETGGEPARPRQPGVWRTGWNMRRAIRSRLPLLDVT
jgi:hypothetical protein